MSEGGFVQPLADGVMKLEVECAALKDLLARKERAQEAAAIERTAASEDMARLQARVKELQKQLEDQAVATENGQVLVGPWIVETHQLRVRVKELEEQNEDMCAAEGKLVERVTQLEEGLDFAIEHMAETHSLPATALP